jgi:hypothetical protein
MEQYNYYLYSRHHTYGSVPNFLHHSGIPKNGGFTSLYAVTEESAKAIRSTGTTKGFKGVVWSERLWLDFDSYEAAERAETSLKEMGYDYIGYDTGGRGAHFGILRTTYPSHLLPYQDKRWAESFFPECDRSIYTHLHPFRLPNTYHEKTGSRKRMVCECVGKPIELPRIEEQVVSISAGSSDKQRSSSIFSCFRVMSSTIPVVNGQRHYQLVRLLYSLKEEAKVSAQEAFWWIAEWNKMLEEPKTDEELEKALRSIYER